MKKTIVFLAAVLQLSIMVVGQSTLSGKIIDTEKHAIANAHIFITNSDTILVSDATGYFQIKLSNGAHQYKITHIEYDTLHNAIAITKDTTITITLHGRNFQFDEVTIYGIKSNEKTPLAYTELKHQELNENNFGQDMPILLQNTVSAVATSDAGNGIGYTSIRIRGSDATRINITLNGVPFNDAESSQSYWVDIPDIALSADAVQVQRGIGFSTNGSGVFGASVNVFTNQLKEESEATVSTSLGSFNLFRTNLLFATGRMKNHWFVEGSGSYTNSNGYIDRSSANLRSVFLTFGYQSNNYKSVINIISGKEKTYQSWGGVPKDSLETNRTFNPYTYANQTDNYTQTHLQWHHNLFFDNESNWNITLNYTMGKGYYEQLEQQQDLYSFGIGEVTVNDSTIYYSDMITQKWLANDFYGIMTDYNFLMSNKNKIVLGGAYFKYLGSHYDEVIWSDYGSIGVPPFRYSDNNAVKQDANLFAQWHFYPTNKIEIISDLQWRTINYQFTGFDTELNTVPQTQFYNFINPKIGLFWNIKENLNSYAYVGYTSKEPNRDDFVNSTINSRPLPEHLLNVELGVKSNIKGWQIQPNIFFMHYKDQLVLDGSINDVGEYTRVNVPESYRAGLELNVSKQLWSVLDISMFGALSDNRIKDYTQYIDNWDNGEQIAETYSNTMIAFSPQATGGLMINYSFLKGYEMESTTWDAQINITSRFVGRQYIDNTEDLERSLDPYNSNDLTLHINCITQSKNNIGLDFMISNFTNSLYESNAWVYPYFYEGNFQESNGYFPQAGRAYYLKLSFTI
ncbi:MAG: TonB-dependent receptor [Chitinophagales bacterium]